MGLISLPWRRQVVQRLDAAGPRLALHVEPRVSEQDRCVLSLLVDEVAREGMLAAEIGSFLGNGSTRTFIEKLRPLAGSLYCVDTWRGNQNVEWHQQLARDFDLFATFRDHVHRCEADDMVKPLVMPSRDAARVFADGQCDLVFIDADHSYEAVLEDIVLWRAKVRRGGILCGHDCEGFPHEFGTDRVKQSKAVDFLPLDGHNFAGFHPGSVLAVHETFGEQVTLWAHRDLSDQGLVGRSSIWSVRISG
jgi:predicted O-methyltransferase YrrM